MTAFVRFTKFTSIRIRLQGGLSFLLLVILLLPLHLTCGATVSDGIVLQPGMTDEFYLSGNDSYALFPTWSICNGASISFMFQTYIESSLLLYVEDSNNFKSYIEVALSRGSLRIRARLGRDMISMRMGDSLHKDHKWHRIRLELSLDSLTVSLDDHLTKDVPVTWDATTTLVSPLYIGGLPEPKKNAFDLALWTAGHEKPFVGRIRDFSTTDCNTGQARYKSPVQSSGLLKKSKNWCISYSQCRNGGRCVNSDYGAQCDCSNTNYEGEYCEKGECALVAPSLTSSVLLPTFILLVLYLRR